MKGNNQNGLTIGQIQALISSYWKSYMARKTVLLYELKKTFLDVLICCEIDLIKGGSFKDRVGREKNE